MNVRSAALSGAALLTREQPAPPAGETRDFKSAAEAYRGAPPPRAGKRFASVAPASYDADAHTVELVLSSGSDVQRWGFIERLNIDPAAIDLSRVDAGAVKVLNSHNAFDVAAILGTIVSARIANGQLIGICKFAATPAAIEAEGMVARGELTSVSIGYSVDLWRAVEIITDPSTGSEVTVWQADAWSLMEVSFVSVPADPTAGVRSANTQSGEDTSANPGGAIEEENEMNLRNASGAAAPATAAAALAATAAQATAATPAADTRAAPAAATPQPVAASRFSGTESLDFVEQGRSFGIDTRARELVEQNSRGEITVEAARTALLGAAADKQRSETSNVNGSAAAVVTADAHDKWMRGAMNSLLQRAGVSDIVAKAAKIRGVTIDLDPGELRGIRNVELAHMALRNMGARVDSFNRDEIVSRAFVYTRAVGAQGTSDFAVLLENTLHKVLQAAYVVAPDTWTQFCGIGSVIDFRPSPRYLRGTFGTLDALNEAGEFKNKPIPDGAKESITAKTKGNIVAISRNAIVNDDLGAFNNIAIDLGRAGKLSIESDVYAALALNSGLGPLMNDGNPLFDASHSNIAATPAAPGVAPFDAIRQLMASQKDLSGNEYLDIRPGVWLGPLSIGGAAKVTNGSLYDPDAVSKLQRPNIVNGMFENIVDTPRLSGTRWYAFADPTTHPAIEVAFLDGVQEPYLEQRLGWRTDGTEWKARLDYGVGALNWRSAATNAGA